MNCRTCDRPNLVLRGGMCSSCRYRLRTGAPVTAPRRAPLPGKTAEERVRYVLESMSGVDDCWEWPYGRTDAGYGSVHDPETQRRRLAHRIVAALTFGPLGPAIEVMHTCDNPSCIRPSHLRLGTHAENMADMARKMRSGNGYLTAEQVIEIRRAAASEGMTHLSIARQFGVSKTTVGQIVRRQTHRWLT